MSSDLDKFMEAIPDWLEEDLGAPRKREEHKDPLPKCVICGMPKTTLQPTCKSVRCVAQFVLKKKPVSSEVIESRNDDIVASGEEIK
jgi:hypothetical protein